MHFYIYIYIDTHLDIAAFDLKASLPFQLISSHSLSLKESVFTAIHACEESSINGEHLVHEWMDVQSHGAMRAKRGGSSQTEQHFHMLCVAPVPASL